MADRPIDVAVVGAGAAGLFAAIFAGRAAPPDARVVAFDGARRLGAKILIAGGGRCNVTHDVVHPEDYAGGPAATRNAVKKVLRSFTVADTVEFFRGHGVELKREDTGKLFPTTDRARTVLDALLRAADDAGAELRTGHRIETVTESAGGGFEIATSRGDFAARRVILCTGGLALPKTGSDGHGYRLARALGHTVTDTWPALVPLRLPDGHWLTTLKGIAVDVTLTLAEPGGKVRRRQSGAMLLTHFGVSGPAAMDLSRHFAGHFDRDVSFRLTANLAPDHTAESLDAEVLRQVETQPTRTLLQFVKARFPERLADALLRHGTGVDPATPLSQLRKDDRRSLIRTLTALPLPVVADRGYEHAEVTAGGVPLSEVDLRTMASRRCDGLHLAGEILDVDGRIGGYNFQWAWCTGRLAGRAAGGVLPRTAQEKARVG
ncbi:MAG: NAD(P)/FAD-dependent oxidoreductase [Planctomycetota bacterium]